MDWQKLTYFGLLLFTISVPLIRSFEHRIHYFGKWKFMGPGLAVTAGIFIIWDVIFTRNDVWHFNPEYVTGIFLMHLPLEEWLFFLFIPFACIFIYEVLNYFFKNFDYPGISKGITIFLLIGSVALTILYHDRTYTLVNSVFASLMLTIQLLLKTHNTYLSKFYRAYFVGIIPFLLVNGVLTALPVVTYNNAENLALRVYTIPVEDFAYYLSLFLMNLNFYEYFKSRSR